MPMKLKELRDQRGKLVHDAREILERAEAEKRALTSEEEQKWEEIITKQDEIRLQIEREEAMQEAERGAAEQAYRSKETGEGQPPKAASEGQRSFRGSQEYRNVFSKFLMKGDKNLTEQEIRALQADSDIAGGYMVAPEQFVEELIKDIDNRIFIRNLARVFSVLNAQTLGVPVLETDPSDADWTAEVQTLSDDSSMTFGKRSLTPHPLRKLIKISSKLLRQMSTAEALVRERLSYKFGVSQEKGFLTGSGSNQALGVFTASTSGISTRRDISTGNTTTAMTLDGLTRTKYSLKQDYLANAQWIFHRDAILQLALIKDGNGQYIWRESVRVGEPDRLLNIPINMSEYAPNTFIASQYVGILGDFQYYWIADALNFQIQALFELYAASGQVGYIGSMETDGMPVLEDAFARVKLAAS